MKPVAQRISDLISRVGMPAPAIAEPNNAAFEKIALALSKLVDVAESAARVVKTNNSLDYFGFDQALEDLERAVKELS